MQESSKPEILLDGFDISLRSPEPITLPLVTFILRNWNYAKYVGSAIDSIKSQSYPRFEVFVLDNASTDGSQEVIETHVDGDPRFKIIHNPANLGPLGGALPGLDQASGDFVCFIDSDDFLFPNFAAMHIQAHLAVERNIAFTSSNVLEIDSAGAILSGTRSSLAQQRAEHRRGLRPAKIVPRLNTVSDNDFQKLSENITSFLPTDTGWLWAPGTANVYRRFIVDLVRPNRPPEVLAKMATDAHFARLAHLYGGSAVITLPLSAYRIHGENYFASIPSVAGIKNGSGPATAHFALRRNEAFRILLKDPETTSWIMGKRYWRAIDNLCTADHGTVQSTLSEPKVLDLFSEAMPELVKVFGLREVSREFATRFTLKSLRAMIAKQTTPPPFSFRFRFYVRKFFATLKAVRRMNRNSRPEISQ